MLYANKSEIARFFGISRYTVYDRVKGIEREIQEGRYGRHAISDGLVNKAVFLDYNTYHKSLEDKLLRKYVPPFDIRECMEYINEMDRRTA